MQYALPVSKKLAKQAAEKEGEEKKLSNHTQRKYEERKKGASVARVLARATACTAEHPHGRTMSSRKVDRHEVRGSEGS